MSDNLRSKMIRLAASMPKGSNERKALLKVLGGTGPDPRGRNWREKTQAHLHRWEWEGSSDEPAFSVIENNTDLGSLYKLTIVLPDDSMYMTYGQKDNKEHWFKRAADLYKRWGSAAGFDLSQTPERWSRM